MSYHFTKRVAAIKPSATVAINTLANELKAAGKQVINLSVGEPDFDTPNFIKEAAYTAIGEGFTKYTPPEGILELRQAIVEKLKKDNHLDYTAQQILVSGGVKQSLYNLIQTVLEEGDEVIIPAPYWVSYPEMAKLAGAEPVIVFAGMNQHFKIIAQQLEQAITPRTRLFILNSPSNPSGMAYTGNELGDLAAVLLRHPQVLIASDDMYEYILWGMPKFINILNVAPELKDRTIVMNGVSKAHAMTGWRIGYAAGPIEIIQNMKKIQSQSTTTTCSISQKAAATAIRADRSQLQYMFDAFCARHNFVHGALKEMPGVECRPADGTFYSLPKVEQVIKRLGLNSDIELAKLLLEKGNVAVVPGTEFGVPNYIRISYANSMENLQAAMRQMAAVFAGESLSG
ncbi:MAG: pyridoxal phosphate-dependent aminotransferase [Proteobacteria bacterium]|nr:pyridoxal phosphate-dependent aminotransferase [Pseudomonadota bacterium]